VWIFFKIWNALEKCWWENISAQYVIDKKNQFRIIATMISWWSEYTLLKWKRMSLDDKVECLYVFIASRRSWKPTWLHTYLSPVFSPHSAAGDAVSGDLMENIYNEVIKSTGLQISTLHCSFILILLIVTVLENWPIINKWYSWL